MRHDILPLLRSIKTKEQYKQLRDLLSPMKEVELFYGLYPIAVESPYQKPPFPILFAGRLLFEEGGIPRSLLRDPALVSDKGSEFRWGARGAVR